MTCASCGSNGDHAQPEPLAVDSQQAAKLLSVSARTLWALTSPRGPIPALRLGRRVVYPLESLRAWIASAQQ